MTRVEFFKISQDTKSHFQNASDNLDNGMNILKALKHKVLERFNNSDWAINVDIENNDDGLIHSFSLKSFLADYNRVSSEWYYVFTYDYEGFKAI